MSLRHLLITCVIAYFSHGAMAFTISPDAGAMLSHTEQSLASHEEKTLEGFPVEYHPQMRWTDDFSVQVNSVVINGNKRVSDDVLQVAVKQYVGRRISVQRLSGLTRLIEKAYRDAGFKAIAYVPEQSFAFNKLVIQVIER